jgi:hypothetical protein
MVEPAVWTAIAGALVGASTTGAFALWAGRVQARREYVLTHNAELWHARFDHYKGLWLLTSDLPRYWPDENPTRRDLAKTIERMHQWFFAGGGLLLSNSSRDKYLQVQDRLFEISRSGRSGTRIGDEEVNALFQVGEDLRVQLSKDLGTAQETDIPATDTKRAPSPPARRIQLPQRQQHD